MIPAKQKAKELVDRFNNKIDLIKNGEERQAAKRCALICVDEIISLNYRVKKEIKHRFNMNLWIKEWQEVKQEIEKL